MSRPRPRSGRGKRPPPSADLGPVPFGIDITVRERAGKKAEVSEGGILAALSTVHRSGYTGRLAVRVGGVVLELKTERDLGVVEELYVFLVELLDAQYGEWTLFDGQDRELILEAQAHGPDVNLEFTGEEGSPTWNGARLPRRATVRLRALVDAGVAAIKALLKQAGKVDPDFGGGGQLAEIWGDLDELSSAVSDLPAAFKPKEPA